MQCLVFTSNNPRAQFNQSLDQSVVNQFICDGEKVKKLGVKDVHFITLNKDAKAENLH